MITMLDLNLKTDLMWVWELGLKQSPQELPINMITPRCLISLSVSLMEPLCLKRLMEKKLQQMLPALLTIPHSNGMKDRLEI